jgi:hypothetical protein
MFMIFSNNGERCTAGSRGSSCSKASTQTLSPSSPNAPSASPSATRWTRKNHCRPDDQPRATWPRCAATSSWAKQKAPTMLCGGLGTPDGARPRQEGQLCAAHRVRRRGQPHAHRAGRDLRPGALHHSVQGRSGRDGQGQRHRLRPVELRLDRTTSAAPTAWPRRSRRACASSTARTYATCASPSAAPRPAAQGREGGNLELRGVLRAQEHRGVDGQHHIPHWGV